MLIAYPIEKKELYLMSPIRIENFELKHRLSLNLNKF